MTQKKIEEFNSFWVSSVARTGSMWITNVVREIFNYTNFNVFPKTSLKSAEECMNLYKSKALKDQNKINKYVLKVHYKIKKIPPGSKVITTIRNPYDICASFHEFMKCNLVTSIDAASLIIDFVNHYKEISKNVFIVRYEDIEIKPKILVNKLALFCNIKLSEVQIENIIKKLIESNDHRLKEAINQNQKLDEQKIIQDLNGNFRSFDPNTGFQSGHISSRKTGDWRKIFLDEEIDIIIKKIDLIAIELGYSSERN